MLALAVVLIAAAVAAVVAAPLVRRGGEEERSREKAERAADLETRKEAKYQEIRDAEADLRGGKLSRDDHRALDRALRHEAVAILEQIDALMADGGGEDRPSGRGDG
jgi:Flp pilus assembly protein TadB